MKPGDYTFDIQAKTTDGQFKMNQAILVKVRERQAVAGGQGSAVNNLVSCIARSIGCQL